MQESPSPLVECVINVSEGRNQFIIDEISKAIENVDGTYLLHVDAGRAANRTVFTFAGCPEAVFESAFQAISVAREQINMTKHRGEHPRIGAADVCPFVPISGIEMSELVQLTHDFGERIGRQLQISGYYYESSALEDHKRNLAACRKGDYEGLAAKIMDVKWKYDFGPSEFNPQFGAIVLGARPFLIAYNINLKSKSAEAAKLIAARLRAKGPTLPPSVPGRLRAIKAIGWYIEEYKMAQVSTNIVDFQQTSLATTFEVCNAIAAEYNIELDGSELIGLIPKQSLVAAGKYYNVALTDEPQLMLLAVKKLGLDKLKPFVLEERVLELVLSKSKAKL